MARSKLWFALLALTTLLGVAGRAPAQLITTDPNLPPDGVYLTPVSVHATYTGPGLSIVLQDIRHRAFAASAIRTPIGPDEREDFGSSVDGNISVNGSPFMPMSATGPVSVLALGKVGNITGTFQTEMLALNLTGTSPFGPFMVRESPTLPSLGQTSITDIGGGLYRIDSFFDVFTELSIDGGNTWMPDISGPARVNLAPVPEPASVLGLCLGAAAIAAWRRGRLLQG